jgi:c-di-GMP-binding flagellar brake protein YcgR
MSPIIRGGRIVTKDPVERRLHARFPRSFEFEGTETQGGTVARMIASDLSLGGLYCSASQDFGEMTRLAVRLLLPEDRDGSPSAEALQAEAVVVRRRKLRSASGNGRYELALYFTRMSDTDRERLARFIAQSER